MALLANPAGMAIWVNKTHIVVDEAYDKTVREVPVFCGSRWCWQEAPYHSVDVEEEPLGGYHEFPMCMDCIRKYLSDKANKLE